MSDDLIKMRQAAAQVGNMHEPGAIHAPSTWNPQVPLTPSFGGRPAQVMASQKQLEVKYKQSQAQAVGRRCKRKRCSDI
jgi:hypothetical protein